MRATTKQFEQITDLFNALAENKRPKVISLYSLEKELDRDVSMGKVGQQIMEEIKEQNDLDIK